MTMRPLLIYGFTIALLGLALLLQVGCSPVDPEAAVAADSPFLTADGSDVSVEAPSVLDPAATSEPAALTVTPDPPDPTRPSADPATPVAPSATSVPTISVEPTRTLTIAPSATAVELTNTPVATPTSPPARSSPDPVLNSTPTAKPVVTALRSPTAPPAPSVDLNGRRLVFADEFTGPGLDESKWQTRLPWGTGATNPPEAQYYVPEGLQVGDGRLRIRAERQAVGGYFYSSGVISSHASFSFTYGYVEARIGVPTGRGLWPSFWLSSVTPKSWQEIDVMEAIGSEPDRLYVSLHWLDPPRGHQFRTVAQTGIDFAKGFHTVGTDWSPGGVVWYIDGVERLRMTEHVPTEPMYVIANLAVGGAWPGYPDASTQFPADLLIDYVRVYQH